MTRKELCNLLLWVENGKKTDQITFKVWDKYGKYREVEILAVAQTGQLVIDLIDRS